MRRIRNLHIRNWFGAAASLAAALGPASIARAAEAAAGHVPNQSGLVELYWTGGIFMHPILLCSIVGLAIIIERAAFFTKARTDTRRLMGDLLRVLQDEGFEAAQRMLHGLRGPVAAVLHSGLARAKRGPEAVEKAVETAASIEIAQLERGLIWLQTVANIAPLLGKSNFELMRTKRSGVLRNVFALACPFSS